MKYLKEIKYTLLFFVIIFCTFFRFGEDKILFTDELLIEDAAYGFSKGEWLIVPEIGGNIDLAKPPLLYWLSSIPYFFLQPQPWMRNILQPVAGLGLIFIIYLFSKRFYDKNSAFWSVMFLVTSFPYIFFTKTANFDLLTTLFISSAIYFYNLSKRNKYYLTLLIVFLSLTILTRSFLSIFAFGTIILDFIFLKRDRFTLRNLVVVILSSIIISAPWHILAYKKTPGNFIEQYLKIPSTYHVQGTLIGDTNTSVFYYFLIFILFPAAIFAVVWAFQTFRKAKRNEVDIQLIIWFLLIFLLLSASKTRHIWYAVSVTTPLSLLAGRFMSKYFMYKKVSFKIIIIYVFTFISLIIYPLLIIFQPLPEAEVIRVTKIFLNETKHTSQNLYLWKYPFLPATRFFPKRMVLVIPSIGDLPGKEWSFIMTRREDLPDFSDLERKIIYIGEDFALIKTRS